MTECAQCSLSRCVQAISLQDRGSTLGTPSPMRSTLHLGGRFLACTLGAWRERDASTIHQTFCNSFKRWLGDRDSSIARLDSVAHLSRLGSRNIGAFYRSRTFRQHAQWKTAPLASDCAGRAVTSTSGGQNMKFVLVSEVQVLWRWELRSEDVAIASSTTSFKSQELAFASVKEFQLHAPSASFNIPVA